MEKQLMTKVVHLRDVMSEMQVMNDECLAFLNRVTGELRTLAGEEIRAVEGDRDLEEYPDWQHDDIRQADEILNSEDWLELPTTYDIHEWEIMRDFSDAVDDERLRNELLDAIHRKGAFRHFKDTIRYRGIEADWHRFHDEALAAIARSWLEHNEIAYTEESVVSEKLGRESG